MLLYSNHRTMLASTATIDYLRFHISVKNIRYKNDDMWVCGANLSITTLQTAFPTLKNPLFIIWPLSILLMPFHLCSLLFFPSLYFCFVTFFPSFELYRIISCSITKSSYLIYSLFCNRVKMPHSLLTPFVYVIWEADDSGNLG